MKMKVVHVEPYRTGGELLRIILNAQNKENGMTEVFEVWTTNVVIQQRLELEASPTPDEISEFVKDFFDQWMSETENKPVYHGAFVTPEETVYGDFRQFPHSVIEADPDPYIRTNISLSKSQYEWAKLRAVQENKSLSEIIRRALVAYRSQ